jgi:hypothetical protein
MGMSKKPVQLENEVSKFPVSEDITPELEKESEKAPLFQAIGTLYGLPERDEGGNFSISLGGQRYHLFILSDRYRAWLTQFEKQPEKPLYLRVYPKYLNIPNQDPIISFQLTAWDSQSLDKSGQPLSKQANCGTDELTQKGCPDLSNFFPKEEKPLEEESGLFRFKGVWQFVPQVRIPVISIYRNQGVNDPKGKFKATHLPILMRREDGVNPFKFNPKVPKEELPKRYFIQAIFKFIPSRNCFGWVEDLEPPTEKIPKYEKPVKAIPTANQQAVKGTKTQKTEKKVIGTKGVSEVKKEKAIALYLNSRKWNSYSLSEMVVSLEKL